MLSSVSVTTERTTAWPVLAGGPQFVAIDSNGNLATKVEDGHTWTYEWNAENELKRVLKDAVEIAHFSYDPKGRRVEKVAGAVTTSYVHDREDILKQVKGGSALHYVHGQNVDDPLAIEIASGQIAYEHADGLGSELMQTNSTGASVFSRSYDAFGQLGAGASAGGYAFTGREWDYETGLAYHRARYYDPQSGRFLGLDPIPAKRRARGHGYAYALNNPASYIDLDGRSPVAAAGTAALYVGWAKICPDKAVDQSSQLYDNGKGGTNFDKKKHCYVGCYVTRCMLFGPGVVFIMTAQLLHEAHGGWDNDADADTSAAAYGAGMAFAFSSCESSCSSYKCPVPPR